MIRLGSFFHRFFGLGLISSKSNFFMLLPGILRRPALLDEEVSEIKGSITKFSNALDSVQLGELCLSISATKHRHFLEDMSPFILKEIKQYPAYVLTKIIVSYSRLAKGNHVFWDKLADEYIIKAKVRRSKFDPICIQKLIIFADGFDKHKESVKEILKNVKVDLQNISILVSLYRFTGEIDKLKEISETFTNEIKNLEYTSVITIAFHLHKEGLLSKANLEAFADVILHSSAVVNAQIFNRIIQIFTNEPHYFESIKPFIKSNLNKLLPSFSIRETINIFNNLMRKTEYSEDALYKMMYDEIIKRPNAELNSLDLSSLLHILKKINYEPEPFLKYCTAENLEKCDGKQLAIILHSIYLTAPEEMLKMIRELILQKMDDLSPKTLMNVAKDMSERHLVDVEFIHKFQDKALEIMKNHDDPDSDLFHTQMASFLMMLKKIEDNQGNR